MERGSEQEVNNLKEGAAVGVWIVRKSKTYPGHNYYFNTLTGAAVWNLSDQEIANAMHMSNINRFDNHAEPREKPPMANLNSASECSHSIPEAVPISTFMCPRSAIPNTLASVNTMDLNSTHPNLNPNFWDLGLHQQIVILPTLTPLNQTKQSLCFGYDLQQRSNLLQRNGLQQINDLQQRNVQQKNDLQQRNDLELVNNLLKSNDLQQRNDLQQSNDLQQRNDWQQRTDLQYSNDLKQRNDLQQRNNLQLRNNLCARGHMLKNRGKVNRGQIVQNSYHKTWGKQDLRKKISKHVNYNKKYINTSKLSFNEGFENGTIFTQRGNIEEAKSYETVSVKENEEDSVSKLDCTPLKKLSKPTVHKNCWYLVVDTNVLIHNFNYLNNLTSTDPTCCFLVPRCVFDELKSYAEEKHDATARRVLRFLFDYAYMGVEDLEIESEHESTADLLKKIYNVCVNIEKDNCHAVLISDDKNLLKYKGVIHVFSMAEVKNMVSVYVSHQNLVAPSSSVTDRVVIINKNNDFHTSIDSNHVVSKRKRLVSESQKGESNIRIVSSPSKSIKAQICTELMKKKVLLKSFNDISITIDNRNNQINTIESTNDATIEDNINPIENSTPIQEYIPRMVEKKNVIRLNRNKLPSYVDKTIDTAIVGTGKKKFRWRKRRNNFKELEKVNESTSKTEYQIHMLKDKMANLDKEIKSKIVEKDESNSCIAVKNTTSNFESLDRRKDMTENEGANSDKEKQLKDLENDDSSSSCTFVKKFPGDSILIDDSSTSEIISHSESNVDSSNILNVQRRPKLFRRFKNSNKTLLNNVMFIATSKAMEESIKMKCDEWVSRFVQIMEDVLTQILRQESVIERIALPPPWSLQEAVQCIIKEFYSHCFVVDAANKLSIISKEIHNTKSITEILPEEFMEMYSYGVILVNALKDVQPNEDLNSASKSLSDLLHDIEFGQNDSFVDEVSEDKGETTLIANVPLKDIAHPISEIKMQNKNSLQKYVDPLRKIKLKSVISNTSPVKKINEDVMVTFIAALPENNNTEIDYEVTNESYEKQETNNSDEIDGLTGTKNHDSITEPKIVRCFTKFPEFEERIKYSYKYLMGIDSTDSDIFYEEDNYETTNCSMHDEDNTDLYETPNMHTYFASDGENKRQVDLFLKKFFNDIKNVLTRAREFCNSCVLYLNKQDSATVDMRLQVTTEKIHSEVISIYYNLSSILSRENGENINYILKNSGCDCEDISEQYRNTIMKCKEQANTILKVIEHISVALKR